MASSSSLFSSARLVAVCLLLAVTLIQGHGAHGHGLSSTYYDSSCPNAYDIVRRVIQDARTSDPRILASLIRLHFHDCFVSGCDGSLLLDDSFPTIVSEKTVPANNNSARGFPVVDDIKSALEHACPGVVSCADILALAAEISVELAGGPYWRVLLGRRDGTMTNIPSAEDLPSPFDSLDVLLKKFGDVGLDDNDLVALQGAHTFGRVQCQFTRDGCPPGVDGTCLKNLDPVTPDVFDSKYYSNLLDGRAMLASDQVMVSTPGAATAAVVRRFASSQSDFFQNFAASMIKMGNIRPLTGNDGEIRRHCRRANGGY